MGDLEKQGPSGSGFKLRQASMFAHASPGQSIFIKMIENTPDAHEKFEEIKDKI